MKHLLLTTTLFFAFFTSLVHASEDYQTLLDSTSRYVEFLNQYSFDERGAREEAELIFAPSFSKTVNGELSKETPESFLEYMERIKSVLGEWYAQVLSFSVSPHTQSATIYCLCTTKENKTYIAFMKLHFNEDRQITELTIVYNLYAGRKDQVHIN
ncbi:hypothetical protein [Parachlamydia sp. AcF125]|uniref:hypothetical protein n=1 Tax=Parachlamydia sp. AcF125 TaxID=2795736 RepID=UPI001BC9FC95|nr:hypothetical protein [Parachlamydia sp. AcF125]MBS4168013.1 hypothetical protein [Parachlamydia sp. AcF125]